ncbi:efflux transporter outer membrane subunit [uncultured Caulobacter sp.]|uniref:efflux transporter outer membrane subunit n=1 Tax=uncultured Caulobacter sp. TaxID=158749 RepID=UPI0026328B5C|nr:efflux transporter outer membrane subunit [uncultured Caulobacter sp.]
MRRLLVLALVGASLSACAAVPSSDHPAAPVTPPAAWRTSPSAQGPLAADWWTLLGDPQLNALVDKALARNADLAVAAARVDEARALSRAAASALLPSVDLAGGIQGSRQLNAFGQTYDSTAEQVGLRVAYEVDLWGRVRSLDAAGRASLQGAAAARDSARLSIAATVARTYVSLLSLDAQLNVARETIAAREAGLKVATRRAEAGYATELEHNQAQAELAGVRRQVPALELAIARLEASLSALTGDPPGAIARGADLFALLPSPIPVEAPSSLLARRPDIAQAQDALIAADANLSASRAQLLPQVRLTASADRVFTDALPDPFSLWNVAGGLAQPLFNGGRLRAQVQASEARRAQAASAYRGVVLNAFAETETALRAVADQQRQETEIAAQRAALADAARRARERYRAGYASFLEQIDAERGLLAADQAAIQAREARVTAAIDLARALGGGWTATP